MGIGGMVILCLCLNPGIRAQECGGGAAGKEITFEAYLNRVGRRNLDYLASRMNVSVAEAEAVAAKVLPDPAIDFEAGRESYSLGVSWSLEIGKRRARTQLARTQAEQEKILFEHCFQELRAGAAERFLDAILQREMLGVKRESYAYMVRLNRSDSLRCRSGEISENDYRQTRLEAVALLNDLYDQEAAYRSALVELNRYMGATADSICLPRGGWDGMERDFSLQALTEAGLAGRLDLKAAAKGVEAGEKAWALARAERRPDVGLSIAYERAWDGVLPQPGLIKVGVSLPLPFSAANKGTVRSAQYRLEQAAIEEQEVGLRIRSEIAQAWYAFEAERRKVAQYTSGILDEARRLLEGLDYKYRRGETDVVELLIAQRSYNEVRRDYLEAMKGYVASLVRLETACGFWDIRF